MKYKLRSPVKSKFALQTRHKVAIGAAVATVPLAVLWKKFGQNIWSRNEQ